MVVYLKSIENRYTGDVFTLEGMVKDKQTYFNSACDYLDGHIFALEHLIQQRENARNETNNDIIDEVIQVYQKELDWCKNLLEKDGDGFDIIDYFFKFLNLKYEGVKVTE